MRCDGEPVRFGIIIRAGVDDVDDIASTETYAASFSRTQNDSADRPHSIMIADPTDPFSGGRRADHRRVWMRPIPKFDGGIGPHIGAVAVCTCVVLWFVETVHDGRPAVGQEFRGLLRAGAGRPSLRSINFNQWRGRPKSVSGLARRNRSPTPAIRLRVFEPRGFFRTTGGVAGAVGMRARAS